MVFEFLGRYKTCVGEIMWRSGTVGEHDQISSSVQLFTFLTTNISEQHTNYKWGHSPLDAYNYKS